MKDCITESHLNFANTYLRDNVASSLFVRILIHDNGHRRCRALAKSDLKKCSQLALEVIHKFMRK